MVTYRRILVALSTLATMLGLALINPSSASATQTGLQQVHVTAASWSNIAVNFPNNCGTYTVPKGQTWGEGVSNPRCGGISGNAEPGHVWVGPGWCVSRWLNNTTSQKQIFVGGSNGGWFQLWVNQPYYGLTSYTNKIESWHGANCPASGTPHFYGWAL